eukprot:6583650-Lingulodinium_polyedra.AAC.1
MACRLVESSPHGAPCHAPGSTGNAAWFSVQDAVEARLREAPASRAAPGNSEVVARTQGSAKGAGA